MTFLVCYKENNNKGNAAPFDCSKLKGEEKNEYV